MRSCATARDANKSNAPLLPARAVAFALDETVEALEAGDRAFCLGVQWHAETLVHHERHAALFAGFVVACAERARQVRQPGLRLST